MQALSITLHFLKKPIKSLPYLLVVLCFSVLSMYAVNPNIGQRLFSSSKSLVVIALPEVLTMLIILALIHGYHAIFKIKIVALSIQSIALYQLKILPVFLTAYFFFYPFTFSVRYLIRYYPNDSFEQYLLKLEQTMIAESYFLYLPSVIILGYMLVNVSLIHDYFNQSAAYTPIEIDALNDTKEEESIEIANDNDESVEYLSVLKVRGNGGDTFLKAEDCIYFEASDHSSLVYHSDGTFRLSMSLAKLEKQLNPDCFFKNNPRYIINLAYLDSYIYTEKGQYALNFKKPVEANLSTTKSRIDDLQSAFQKYRTLQQIERAKPSPALLATD
jgi:two-component system, LytTR family, response regulator